MRFYDGHEHERPTLNIAVAVVMAIGAYFFIAEYLEHIGGEPPAPSVQAYRDCVRQTPPELLSRDACVVAKPYSYGDDRE